MREQPCTPNLAQDVGRQLSLHGKDRLGLIA